MNRIIFLEKANKGANVRKIFINDQPIQMQLISKTPKVYMGLMPVKESRCELSIFKN